MSTMETTDPAADQTNDRQQPQTNGAHEEKNPAESDPESPTADATVAEPAQDDGLPGQKFTVDLGNKRGENLQNAFIKYQLQRQKELKKLKKRKRKEVPNEVRLRALADPHAMWRLRMKFLEQAKKYFGFPYAKKYWKPTDPEYHSRLFLDCCGLVRRVMYDLKNDFGFKIGPWNQCYMCDTLPIIIDREEDMKPGDLVFISATYYNTKMKKQKHNLTHVEIWLGDGPKTIGARWHKGKVQVFDSYAFKATSYHSESYIFKSLDTWLMGICRSHCREHTWRTRSERFKPGKKSIFRVPLHTDPQPIVAVTEEELPESAGDSTGDDEPGPGNATSEVQREPGASGEGQRPVTDASLPPRERNGVADDRGESQESQVLCAGATSKLTNDSDVFNAAGNSEGPDVEGDDGGGDLAENGTDHRWRLLFDPHSKTSSDHRSLYPQDSFVSSVRSLDLDDPSESSEESEASIEEDPDPKPDPEEQRANFPTRDAAKTSEEDLEPMHYRFQLPVYPPP